VRQQAKFGIGIGVIVISLGFLAWLGYGESKTYYHTIAELQTLHGASLNRRMRVGGTVEASSRATYTKALEQFLLDGTGVSLGLVLAVAGAFVRANLR